MYEAHDNAIFFYFRSFDQFKADYARIPITDTIPDFIDIETSMLQARKFLESARREEEKREAYYEQAMTQYDIVSKAWTRLEAARGELNKIVEAFNRTLENEAAQKAETARANADAVTGRKMTIRMGWIVGAVTAIINLAIGVLRVFW